MPEITLADLETMGACDPAREAFAAQFPDGATYKQLLFALAEHPQGVGWWEWLAPRVDGLRQAQEQYKDVRRPAWEQYVAVERQAWEQYVAVERQAWEQYVASGRPVLLTIAETLQKEGKR